MVRRRRPPLPPLLAVAVTLALGIWLAFGDLQRFQEAPPEGEPAVAEPATRVEVVTRVAEPHAPRLVLQGHLTADRELTLRVRQTGRVEALPIAAGSRVEAGTVLLELAREELPARLEQAEAELALARAELAGADDLRRRELISNTDLLRLQSGVSRAVAEVATLRRQLDDTRPRAPFAGVLDRLDAELGDLAQDGEAFGRLVDDTHLVARAWVPQRDAQELEVGLPATLRLLDGSRLEGEVSLVGRRAEEEARSFAVEAQVANPERRRLAGASATLVVTLPERRVHRLSPALLELDDEGRLAVKHLDDDDRVLLTAVTLVDAVPEEARVVGLPERVRLITLGGGLVAPGERVEAVAAEPAAEAL
ncbi:efflux RND transporter periplasmic adaptor subunit [Halomonas sp. BM-2019]|uniref:efflux RND transporter periplasmic adaptor subunit n=1 Tax=Halomonas sp. BM-2019 TaxID=2811227 RepID=UPI001B3C227A|nr:MAG: efflux RND transporter periplasmic adaptor subunit [Halomonas sp. BM-2019]